MPPEIGKLKKIFKTASNLILIIFGIGFCLQLFHSHGIINWVRHPLIGNIFGIGIGVCFSIMFFVLSYLAWSLNEDEFDQWSLEQIKGVFLRELTSRLRESRLAQLQSRFIGILGFVLSFSAVVYSLYQIILAIL